MDVLANLGEIESEASDALTVVSCMNSCWKVSPPLWCADGTCWSTDGCSWISEHVYVCSTMSVVYRSHTTPPPSPFFEPGPHIFGDLQN